MAAAIEIPPAPSIHTKQMATKAHSCPQCGTSLPVEREVEGAQRRIRELESQVEMLKEKATAAGMFIADLRLVRPSRRVMVLISI